MFSESRNDRRHRIGGDRDNSAGIGDNSAEIGDGALMHIDTCQRARVMRTTICSHSGPQAHYLCPIDFVSWLSALSAPHCSCNITCCVSTLHFYIFVY